MRYEKMILGRICCEKAPQVVRAWAQAVLGPFQNNDCLFCEIAIDNLFSSEKFMKLDYLLDHFVFEK